MDKPGSADMPGKRNPIVKPGPRPASSAAGMRPKKSLGQNFLRAAPIAAAIVAQAQITLEESVLEIGPGLGALTVPLARAARRVVAIEKDEQLAARLEERLQRLGIGNVTILRGDVLRLDLGRALGGEQPPWTVIGNLPYYISSPVLLQLIDCRQAISRAVLMFQKELAQRLCAQPSSRDYGRITVMLTYHASVRRLLDIAAHEFHPRPAVDSQLVEIRFHARPPWEAADESFFGQVVRAAFGQRRKSLKNALEAGLPLADVSGVNAALARVGIDPLRRAETLSVAEFVNLTAALRADR